LHQLENQAAECASPSGTDTDAADVCRVLILGGGFGGIYAALELERALRRRPEVEVTLATRDNYFLFTPMLHEVAASDLEISAIVNPLRRMLRRVRTFCGSIETIDLAEKCVTVSHGFDSHRHDLHYDHLILALGSSTKGYPGPLFLLGKALNALLLDRIDNDLDRLKRINVILDAGTTVYHVARHLEEKAPQIVTNSLPVANLFASANKVEVILAGGVIYPRLGVLVGPMTVEAYSRMRADVAIMSAGGITLEGITNSHALLIDIQRAMLKAAQKIIFCLDHSKFGRQSVSPLCELELIDTIVTDSRAPQELVAGLRERGVEVIVAPAPPEPANGTA